MSDPAYELIEAARHYNAMRAAVMHELSARILNGGKLDGFEGSHAWRQFNAASERLFRAVEGVR